MDACYLTAEYQFVCYVVCHLAACDYDPVSSSCSQCLLIFTVHLVDALIGGALNSFLKKQGSQQTTQTLVRMGVDIANGMAYLASSNCIHR